MARPLRIEHAGAHYHVTSQGNERKAIFRDDTDRGEVSLNEAVQAVQTLRYGPQGAYSGPTEFYMGPFKPCRCAAVPSSKFGVKPDSIPQFHPIIP